MGSWRTRAGSTRTVSGGIAGSNRRDRVLTAALLLLLLLTGGIFRFTGLNWDDFTFLHPDERFLTDVVSSIGGGLRSTRATEGERSGQVALCMERYPASHGAGPWFDTECSTLNPHNVGKGIYVYGTLPLFLARATGEALTRLTGDASHSSFYGLHLVWRGLSALAETAVILVVFLTGATLLDRRTATLAAALYSVVVFSIQQSHFGTVDAITNLCCALGLLFAARVWKAGRPADYALFGLFCGCALASRINVAPLAGLVLLAPLPHIVDRRRRHASISDLSRKTGVGLVAAGLLTALTFRVLNPYAFSGPGFFDLTPNLRWLEDVIEARSLVSGLIDIPPNWQWLGRAPWLFPLNNILLWGLGPGLGLAAAASALWALLRLLQRRPGSTRLLLPLVWALGYFALLGGGHVASMRYFLPLYPALTLLAAWGLIRLAQGSAAWRRTLALLLSMGVLGFSALWGLMFSNIYRHQLTRVQASHWFWERVPGDFALSVAGGDAEAPLINIPVANRGSHGDLLARASRYETGQPFSQYVHATADGELRAVHIPHVADPLADDGVESLLIVLADPVSGDRLAEGRLEADLSPTGHMLGDARDVALEPALQVKQGQELLFTFEVLDGGPVTTGGSVVAHEGVWEDAIPYLVCTLPPGVTLADDPPPGLLNSSQCRGRNAWSGLLLGVDLGLSGEDDDTLRARLINGLHNSDYISISSNRFYDSKLRNPLRWPLTERYYKALFSGKLGFDLVAQFEEGFELGPLRFPGQHLPTHVGPAWLNEFEPEEAFHVYDHPTVFVFAKSETYDPSQVEAILREPPLNTLGERRQAHVENCPQMYLNPGGGGCDTTLVDVLRRDTLTADAHPDWLLLDDERQGKQIKGGSWSERFDSDSPLNREPLLAIAGWWLAVTAFGLAAWPWLNVALPGLADRGLIGARIAGLLLVAWLAWAGSSLGLPLWNRNGIALLLAGVLVSGLVVLRRQGQDATGRAAWSWRRLLAFEALFLLLFLGFLLVRGSNPDLWHTHFGGEKPMDFAYFNATLRSSIFPPYDPWYAGGYVNYYYFGFVLVGAPVLLTGIQPAIAYNLILPTLFALTGMGAFGVAFNLVYRRRVAGESEAERAGRPAANPWVAGLAALMLAVILGNLDTLRVLGNGLAQLGGYTQPQGLADYLEREFALENGTQPLPMDRQQLLERAQANHPGDRLRYEWQHGQDLWTGLLMGAGRWLEGDPLPIASHRWYWAPTRILAETPGTGGNAITEMPWFTFLYGDLHAHMIAMPLQLLVLLFAVHEFRAVEGGGRRRAGRWPALIAGAMAAGMLRATNTWDWPTFMLLGIVAVAGAWWLEKRRGGAQPVRALLTRVSAFLLAAILFALPFTHWYATGYDSLRLWQGGRTPLWAWLDIHGLFVFLLLSLLVRESARWMRGTQVGQLRGKGRLLVGVAVLVLVVLALAMALAMAGWQVALPALPMMVWCVLLFLRPGQSAALQVALGLAALALALTLGVEFLVLQGDIGRQNTVFKFYIQAWLLLSVAGGVAFAWLLGAMPRWPGALRLFWALPGALLLFMAALYPLLSTPARALDRMAPGTGWTLDGMAYMRQALHHENGHELVLADDHALIRWLQEEVEGAPVILEAHGSEYRWGGRVSIYTGLPSLLGWRFHQTQQRSLPQQALFIDQRRANINGLYSTVDSDVAWKMLQFYDLRYVVVGGLERAWYPTEGLAKFEEMVGQGRLRRVFEQGQATLYEVIGAAA